MYNTRFWSKSRKLNSPDSMPNKNRDKKRKMLLFTQSQVVQKSILIWMLIKPIYVKTDDLNIIEERKSEDWEGVKKENIQNISELKAF